MKCSLEKLVVLVAECVPTSLWQALRVSDTDIRVALVDSWMGMLSDHNMITIDDESFHWLDLDDEVVIEVVAHLDEYQIESYRYCVEQAEIGDSLPIVVEPDGEGGFVVRDGNHRNPALNN